MDQAFVKAFARRTRGAQNQPVPAEPVARPEQADVNAEPGSLQVDRSVASTAEVWVDPIEDQIARADQPSNQIPSPHVGHRNPNRAADTQPPRQTVMGDGLVTEDRETPQPAAPANQEP